jgi:hypothetical protein
MGAIMLAAVLSHDRVATSQPAFLELLNGETVLHWANVAIGL